MMMLYTALQTAGKMQMQTLEALSCEKRKLPKDQKGERRVRKERGRGEIASSETTYAP
jgi:hypothetical protein